VSLPWVRPASALIAATDGVVRKVIAGSPGARLAGGDAIIRGGERELRLQAGPRAARAVEKDPAAERLHTVL
jgi:hypothetical protein